MRIGIDAYPLVGQFTGIGRYIYNIIKNLEKIDKRNEYILYSHRNIQLPFPSNSRWRVSIIKGFLNRSGTFWMQTQARRKLKEDKIDLFWATAAILPLNLPSSIKIVLTVHDLTWLYYPKTLKWDNRIIFPLFFKRSLVKADRIIAVSASTAKGIKEFIPELNNKVSVVYEGVGEEFRPFDKMEAKKYVSLKFGTSLRYILTVATIEPRKNLDNLLRAYARIIKDNPNFDYQLLIAGAKGWKNLNIYKTYKELELSEKQVKFLGYVSDTDMAKLYSGAEVFILPSLYEGFGLPPLEAMASGTPVIASDIPVFREILDDAALLICPYNPEDIASGIHSVLTNKGLAEELRNKGLERVKLFSWEKTARKTLQIFEELK